MTQPQTHDPLLANVPDQDTVEALAEYFDRSDTTAPDAWEEADDAVIERPELELISIRLPRADVQELKRRAAHTGIGYTTLTRMIVRAYLHDRR